MNIDDPFVSSYFSITTVDELHNLLSYSDSEISQCSYIYYIKNGHNILSTIFSSYKSTCSFIFHNVQ